MKTYRNDHGSMNEAPNGMWVDISDVRDLQRQLADVTADRDELLNIIESGKRVYEDIGRNLCANMPAELVNEVARRRMRQLQIAREALQSIARSYPKTEEGDTLASMACDALKEIPEC